MQYGSSAVPGELRGTIAHGKTWSAPAAAAPVHISFGQIDPGSRTKERQFLVNQLGFALIFVQVVLVALLLRQLDMQTAAFRHVVYLATFGFVINHYLPQRLRLPFFALLSVGSVLMVTGASPDHLWDPRSGLLRGGAILGLGLLLIGICHLPIGFWKRALLLLAAGGIAAIFRGGMVSAGGVAVIWPILASLFMFRVIVYLYDLSTSKERPKLSQSLAYFFLIPNVCCALFPVIDFKTFTRSHYNEPALQIYQRGVRWMGRGVVQLLIYRFIDQLVSIKASDVMNGTDLVQFLITNSFLYLKVSGQFHLFIGLILLFGFNLPETNHRYFLSSSFTDYWRRVNIYWKDFMMKVFYYPTFFKLKHLGQTKAMILATIWTFFITWALHLYQTWWLKGSATFNAPDTIFWSALAVLVIANSLWEMKRGRTRKLTTSRYSMAEALSLTLKTGATFVTISILWSLWSSDSLTVWSHAWSLADWHTLGWGAAIVCAIMLAKFVIEVLPEMKAWPSTKKLSPQAPVAIFRWEMVQCLASLSFLFLFVQPSVQTRLTALRWQPYRDALVAGDSMSGDGAQRGYYERLTNADEANRQLWETLMMRRIEPSYTGADPVRSVNDFRFREYLPSVHLPAYDTDFQTNRWGMRDREYDLQHPAGTLRIAVLGSSHVMGWGVPEDQVFTRLVETQLNQTLAQRGRIELLNFAINGLSPLGQMAVIDHEAAAFQPDVVLFISHTIDKQWVRRDLPRALRLNIPVTDPYLNGVLSDARITPRTPAAIADERLEPYSAELAEWSYRQIVARCRAINALPVCAFMPLPFDLPMNPSVAARQVKSLEQAGFVVLDLSQAFDGKDPRALMLNDPLKHSSVLAHQTIADALQRQLISKPAIALPRRAARLGVREDSQPERSTFIGGTGHGNHDEHRTIR